MSKYIIKYIHKRKHYLLLLSPPSSFSPLPSSHKPVPLGGFPHKPHTTPSFSDFLKRGFGEIDEISEIVDQIGEIGDWRK